MKYLDKQAFEKANMFGTGVPNEMFAKYFIGDSFLNLLVNPEESPLFMANVTFEPGCRNNWHIHRDGIASCCFINLSRSCFSR